MTTPSLPKFLIVSKWGDTLDLAIAIQKEPRIPKYFSLGGLINGIIFAAFLFGTGDEGPGRRVKPAGLYVPSTQGSGVHSHDHPAKKEGHCNNIMLREVVHREDSNKHDRDC